MPHDSRLKPEFALHLDGKKLAGEEAAAILGIRVYQTRSGASAFEIVVSDPDLSWQGKPTFTECKEVKIELGAPGKLKPIFDGEVTAWRTELERAGPTVLVLRGLDRSHRLMRARKTKTYANASPIDCARQIAGEYGLSAKTRAGSPAPVKTFRFQANQTDFDFLGSLAELEGYLFWIDGTELHYERPELSIASEVEFSFGEDLKTFLPVANFRRPAISVDVAAWDVKAKTEITGKAKTGDELWSVPGGKAGASLCRFTSSKSELSLLESRAATQEHVDTVAKAALTRRALEFITAEVEVQGDPSVRPGTLVNLKKVGAFSGHYLVTEANHFFDGAGYSCIFYVARDKWGDSSTEKEKKKQAKEKGGKGRKSQRQQVGGKEDDAEKKEPIESTHERDQASLATLQLEGDDEDRGEAASEGKDEEEATPSVVGRFRASHFATDKTFPLPEAIPTFRQIATFAQKEPHRTLLVVGHTDSTGSLEHNKALSLERAEAVAAYFRNDAGAWMRFYDGTSGSKAWGDAEDRHMLRALPYGSESYGTLAAFRAAKGISSSGPADVETRRALIEEYMAADGTTTPDPVDIQTLACADWHRVEETSGPSEKNRRVEVFAFEDADFTPPASECKGHGGSGDKGSCTAYDRWLRAAVDLGEPGEAPAAPKEDGESIEAIAGPAEIVVGKEARYTISKDARIGAKRQRNARWTIEVLSGASAGQTIACEGDDRFTIDAHSMTIKSVPGNWNHARIAVRAFTKAANDKARLESAVSMEPIVIADSWTNPDSSGHRPGIGPDFASGDMSERQYRDLGTLFNLDYALPGGLGFLKDEELFRIFREMAVDIFSSGEMVANTNAMIDKLQKNEGGDYSNEVLTRHAHKHESTRRFVTNLRGKLSAGLAAAGGDAGKLTRFARIPSPVYGTVGDKVGGLTIAVNDTWAYEVELIDYELIEPKKYRAKLKVHIYDHFGLDKADLEGKGISALGGFRAWLLLQRVRGYKPFVTKIEFEEELEDAF